MRTKTFLAAVIFFQIFCSPQPVRCQKAIPDSTKPPTELKMSTEAIPPIQYHQAPPPPPFDPQIAKVIHGACCDPTDHVKIQLASGLSWKGRVMKLHEDDTDSFDFSPRGTKLIVRFDYREVASVNRIGPSFEEGFLEGLKAVALGAALVALVPVAFAMGLGCNFQCS